MKQLSELPDGKRFAGWQMVLSHGLNRYAPLLPSATKIWYFSDTFFCWSNEFTYENGVLRGRDLNPLWLPRQNRVS
jgi:hypothetical protein